MADIINLNRIRKERARAEKAGDAAGNRAKFGRTKAEREATKAQEEKRRKALESHRVESTDDDRDDAG